MSEDTHGKSLLERGLAEAYGPRNGESVLQVLGALTGEAPRIDLNADPAKPISIGGDHGTRYEVVEELARGGMGVVLRSKDIDLGREVAMKVIRPEHARQGDVLRRFVEEAQIGGQLEHPGIVPVYELGMQEDQQVYFTMKLIQGTTLSDLLKERATPTEHRRKFLSIFETICQTIAYAHSRGVIHRDIKPANVMVGAFGEVQVVDWGFAKVLGAADPQVAEPAAAEQQVQTIRTRDDDGQSKGGAVMGTPAYMPPEQAYGRTEELDRRTDVFALGSTLCEILTGRPAYLSENGNLLVQAAQHRIGDALTRLEACTADGELVQLAQACLDKQALRPRDASEVAEAVSDYLTSVEERARAAELEAAEERVKAKEEKRRRRLTVALAATALLVVLVGGGAWGWSEKARLDRMRTHTIAVAGDIREATGLEAEARTSGLVPKWAQAVLAARKAVSRAETDEVDAEVLSDAHTVLARVEQGHDQAVADEASVARDGAMTARLHEIRQRLGHALRFSEMDADYAEAFREYGIDMAALDVDTAIGRLQESAVAHELVAALDTWANGIQMMSAEGAERAKGLLRAAGGTDADPWRAAVRTAGAEGDEAELLRLAGEVNPAEIDAASALLMARSLAATHTVESSITFLRGVQPFHPDDFWINFRLGVDLGREDDAYAHEATAYIRAALAVRPESTEARHFLGLALAKLGDVDGALAVWQEALRLKPDYHHLHIHIITTLHEAGRLAEARAEIEARIREAPDDGVAYWRLGIVHRLSRNPGGAVQAMRKAVELKPDLAVAHAGLGYALMSLRRGDEALIALKRATELAPHNGNWFLWMANIYEAKREGEKALERIQQALRTYPAYPFFRVAFASALVRRHRLAEALQHYEESKRLHAGKDALIALQCKLSAALWHEGYIAESKTVAREGVEACRKRLAEDQDDTATLSALGGLLCDCLWEFEEAISVFRHLAELEPNRDAFWGRQVAHQKMGDAKGAEAALREVLERWPGHALAHQRLGWILSELGDWRGSMKAFEESLRLRPRDMHSHHMLRILYLRAGRYERAMEQHERHYDAIKWQKLGRRVSKETWMRDGETYVALAKRADAILKGKDRPETPREMLLFARLLQDWYDAPAALPFFRAAFEADPAVAEGHLPSGVPFRWGAVYGWTAIEAGLGLGPKAAALDETTRAALRKEGREKMRKELVYLESKLAGGDKAAALYVGAALDAWLINLQRTRYGRLYEALPEAERKLWDAFWKDVTILLRRAREGS